MNLMKEQLASESRELALTTQLSDTEEDLTEQQQKRDVNSVSKKKIDLLLGLVDCTAEIMNSVAREHKGAAAVNKLVGEARAAQVLFLSELSIEDKVSYYLL